MNESGQINLHSLPKIAARGKKRVGRGYGSGKGGHTSGRGQKGQRSRRTIPWSFEGGALPMSQRVPFWRGKGRLNPLSDNPVAINLNQLDKLPAGTTIDAEFLVKKGWVKNKEITARGAKILGGGKLTKKLTIVGLKISASAKAAVEKAGGKVEEPQSMLATSHPPKATHLLAGRSRGAQLRGSDAPADFSKKKNLGSSEKTAKKVEKVEKKEVVEKKVVKKKAVAKPKKA
ncbi:50S ribosomal protein L15 [Candidatus Collierbacteria bacterium]|nr:50S ribosomal protein L15 [Candidatus Collierbacteria bacterium]